MLPGNIFKPADFNSSNFYDAPLPRQYMGVYEQGQKLKHILFEKPAKTVGFGNIKAICKTGTGVKLQAEAGANSQPIAKVHIYPHDKKINFETSIPEIFPVRIEAYRYNVCSFLLITGLAEAGFLQILSFPKKMIRWDNSGVKILPAEKFIIKMRFIDANK